jgi:ABC-type lipoprotein export system ATPase subunit
MIRLENITKRFTDGQHTLTVLDALSLQVDRGEFIAVTGESGAGKTTLLSILGTLLLPDEGRYFLHNTEISASTQPSTLCQLRNQEIGFVYQDHRLLPQFTVWQNILLPTLATKSASTDDEQQRALELLDFMGILDLKEKPVTILSGGEQARVAIARALINQPSLLLADEPTGQLDAANAQAVADLFRKVNTELHTTVIMATHSSLMAKVARREVRVHCP